MTFKNLFSAEKKIQSTDFHTIKAMCVLSEHT